MCRLITSAFKILPFLFCGPDTFFGGFKLRHRRRFLRQDVRFLRPENTTQHRGMGLVSEIQADGTGDNQENDEARKNQTTLAEASHFSLLVWRWTFEPGIHFAPAAEVSAAARNF